MKQNNIKEKILNFFFTYPTKRLRLREIEREVKVPLPSAIRYTKELVKSSHLKSVKISNVTFYTADRSSRKFIVDKRLSNIKMLYDSGLVDFLIDEYSNPTIILFGSYFKGEDIENSDIDLFILTSLKKKVELKQFEKALNRRLQLFLYNNIRTLGNKDLMNNVINGFVLNGSLEVF